MSPDRARHLGRPLTTKAAGYPPDGLPGGRLNVACCRLDRRIDRIARRWGRVGRLSGLAGLSVARQTRGVGVPVALRAYEQLGDGIRAMELAMSWLRPKLAAEYGAS